MMTRLILTVLITLLLTKPAFARETYSVILPLDRANPILSGAAVVEDPLEMEAKGLLRGQLDTQAWSDTYWPIMYGSTGWRYADPKYPRSKEFAENLKYFEANPPESVKPEYRSPAEKYDALVGDATYALTRASWKSGSDRLAKWGKVLDWEGLCHGWAAAAYSEPEPMKSVTVPSATGELITFTPSDIKALTTLIYATGDLPVQFIGSKCFAEKPEEDPIGRNLDPDCLTNNPGTWHLAVVNRIGVAKKSFIMDITYDQAIWNQPIVSYSYSYFNPQTFEVSSKIADSAIPIVKFARDKFKTHRAPGTAYVVGVNMDVTYARENQPSPSSVALPTAVFTVRYVYDLELDANRKIIGGEWHSKRHPDFLWTPVEGTHPRSQGEIDKNLNLVWNTTEPIPAPLLEAARVSSPQVQPVYGIVKGLIQLSTQGRVQP